MNHFILSYTHRFFLILFMGFVNLSFAQYFISGPTSVNTGETHLYTIEPSSSVTGSTWTLGSGCVLEWKNHNSATIRFTSTGLKSISAVAYDANLNNYPLRNLKVVVTDPLTAGSIGGGGQVLCPGGNPSNLNSISLATGGTGSYSYQWQLSTSSGSSGFSDISGATGTSYNPPSGLNSSTWYRRKVTSGSNTAYSNAVKVTVSSISAGTIQKSTTVCYAADPTPLTNVSSASGGNGSYSYQWQYSNNNSSWNNISGATGTSYDPPGGATSTRWYRRRVQGCSQTKYSNVVKVTVRPNLSAGGINGTDTICYGEDPSNFGNTSSASGGNGSYSYQWQYSTNGSSGWTNISGATGTSYNPSGSLYSDRWYRRRVQSCSQTKYTGSIKITVRPDLSAGSINGTGTICYGEDPSNLGNTSSASGGSGSYSYQWQYSTNGSSGWTNISGATGSGYDPSGSLYSDRWYRRRVQSCSQTKYTGSIKITVRPDLSAGSINGAQSFCEGGDPSSLGNISVASGGNGSYSYQWQYSTNGSSGWTNISGATGTSYNPSGSLYSNRWYRRRVQSCSQTKYTGSIKVTVTAAPVWYADTDGDGFGDPGATTSACTQPSGYVGNDDDLDDGTEYITNITPQYFYGDSDGDGFGDPNVSVYYSVQPSGYVPNNGDLCPGEYGTNQGCAYDAAVPSDRNYVHAVVYQRPLDNATEIISNRDVVESITYYDGLGRPMQNIAIKGSPGLDDIVTHMGYDAYGRSDREWLPYVASTGATGSYRPTAGTDTDAYYVSHYGDELGNEPNPFSRKELELSPLSRVFKQAAPGEDWQLGSGNEIEFEYRANSTNEVSRFLVNFVSGNTESPELVKSSNDYFPGELYKTITRDENHDGSSSKLHSTEEFTDKLGRVVLKRTYADLDMDGNGTVEASHGETEVPHDTYYVYDDYGNLTYVVPPKVDTSDGVDSTELGELCYQYVYDHRNRLVEKKLPGKGREYIVYNKLDQPIMTRDVLLQGQGKWLFTRYDAHGRVAFTGMVNGGTRTSEQTAANSAPEQWAEQSGSATTVDGAALYYNGDGYPALGSVAELHTINYYDGYNATRDGIAKPVGQVLDQDQATDVTGLPTVTKVRVLDRSDWISTLTVYDVKGRGIWSRSENPYLGTTDVIRMKLDFTGKMVLQEIEHTKDSDPTITVTDAYDYDHAGRLISQEQTIENHTETLFVNQYDALGQLVAKDVGNTTGSPLQTYDYEYNIRGWLKQINDPANLGNDLFAFGISYNDPTDFGVNENPQALYNGNISQVQWSTASTNTSGNPVSDRYSYSYDALNRITSAADNTGHYNLVGISYDKNGNIGSLERKGHTAVDGTGQVTSFAGSMDELEYEYHNSGTSNRLYKVRDYGNDTYGFKDSSVDDQDYWYDGNGNMTQDDNKGITSIVYNHLNLPTNIVTGSGNISYVYDALGTKLEKEVSGGSSVTQYADNFVYSGPSGSEALQFMGQPEGYVTPDGMGGYDYVYQYRDHMGNVRLSYTDANNDGDIATSEIIEESNYYPFGLKHQGYNNNVSSFGNSNAQRWKYQGQELNEDFGLNVYEFKYRMHDPAIGRFWQVDPLAEDYAYNSTYAFQENKLGIGIELEGLEVSRHEWLDDNGQNNIRYDAHIKVFNNSSASINDVIDYANGIAGQIESDFSGTDSDGNIVSTSVSLEFVAEVDPENDYYIEFTDKVIEPDTGEAATAEGKANVIGDAEVNRMQVLIPGKSGASFGEPVTEDRLPYTGAHEYGHTVGLEHQVGDSNKSPGGRIVGSNNLMRRSNDVMRQRGGVNGGQLSVLQNTVNTPFMVNFRKQMRQSKQQFKKTMKKILNPKL